MTYREMLYEYMYNKEVFLMNECIQLSNNVAFRDADALDHLEMIIASAKLEAAREIFQDFRFLLRLGRDGGLGAQPPD